MCFLFPFFYTIHKMIMATFAPPRALQLPSQVHETKQYITRRLQGSSHLNQCHEIQKKNVNVYFQIHRLKNEKDFSQLNGLANSRNNADKIRTCWPLNILNTIFEQF